MQAICTYIVYWLYDNQVSSYFLHVETEEENKNFKCINPWLFVYEPTSSFTDPYSDVATLKL